MNLTRFALDNERLVGLLTALSMAAGVAFYLDFPSKEDPEVTVREAVVTALYPGMSPERVEDLITRKLEKKIRLIPEVEHIQASSKAGMAIVHVIVSDRFFDMARIWQDLRNKMNDVREDLPEGTAGPFVNDEFGDVYVATVAITAAGFSMHELRDVARAARDEIYSLDGVKKVVLHGAQREQVYLETSDARLARYGISPIELERTLRDQNVILPGGSVDTGLLSVAIEPSGSFETVEDIENLLIRIPATGDVAYLKDLVRVNRAYVDPPETKAYFGGRPAVVLAVSMMKGGNVLEFGPRLRERVKRIEAGLPVGYQMEFATYQARYVAESVQGVALNVYETLGIVLVVVMVFLGVRTGLIVGTVVPMTMLLTIVIMRVLGIELQRVSLATLIIALGLLVDNGIVMAEEIGRRLREGEDRRDAAIAAGRSLAIPLLTSSITTILAFMPLALAPDDTGEYLRSMTIVIAVTLLCSWLLAVCVTPLLCVRWMQPEILTPEQIARAYEGRMFQIYRALLERVLRRPVSFVSAIGAALASSVVLLEEVPQQFMPNSPRSQFMIYVDLPAGYGFHATDAEVRRLLDWLGDEETNPEVASHVAYVGYGGPRFFVPLSPRDAAPNVAFVLVNTKSVEAVDALLDRTRRRMTEHHPVVFSRVKKFWLGTSETGLVKIRVSGQHRDRLAALGEDVRSALRAIPGTIDVHSDWENRVSKVRIRVDQPRARRAGVSSREVATSLNGYFSGEYVTDYREADRVIPVVFRAIDSERRNLDRVRSLNIYSEGRGADVGLLQVADFEARTQLSRIERRDLARTITISAKHAWLQAAQLEEELAPALERLSSELPLGYSLQLDGETKDANDANQALAAFVPHALAAMVVILVWQFNSFLKPAIVFITIPITFIGAIAGLWLTDSYLGFMATLGFLSLAGIIINNAIVLLETIQSEIDSGETPYDAVVFASVSRFQPVMMTTLTTVLGLIPLMVPADPLFSAMAVVISFGIGFGTLLTLLAVPALYALFFRVEFPARARV